MTDVVWLEWCGVAGVVWCDCLDPCCEWCGMTSAAGSVTRDMTMVAVGVTGVTRGMLGLAVVGGVTGVTRGMHNRHCSSRWCDWYDTWQEVVC